ncbi:hypothetical protein HHI36_013072 [Cryptolaemus montrouzieri]|uniref:Uncharacterized protein n=1 Tax=Cryptolaemus montrouzieri TaxID=559131 RepID=A0ABD2NG09_9CUCU
MKNRNGSFLFELRKDLLLLINHYEYGDSIVCINSLPEIFLGLETGTAHAHDVQCILDPFQFLNQKMREGHIEKARFAYLTLTLTRCCVALGPAPILNSQAPNVLAFNCVNTNINDLIPKFWQIEETTGSNMLSVGDKQCDAIFKKSTKRLGNGRSQVDLPLVNKYNENTLVSASLIHLQKLFHLIFRKMTIDFYYIPASAPCRTVLLTAKALGVELNLKLTDLMKGEHLTPEFIEINPQHTVPTLVDNGFAVWESRVIATYLVSQYGKDDSLYPKDPKKRAIVDQRLYFDLGTLYARYADYYYPVYFGGAQTFDSSKMDKIKEAFQFLNVFLQNQDFVAGDHLTVADLSIVATVSTYEVSGYDISAHPNVAKWYSKVKATAPGYEEANGKNALLFKELIEQAMKKK